MCVYIYIHVCNYKHPRPYLSINVCLDMVDLHGFSIHQIQGIQCAMLFPFTRYSSDFSCKPLGGFPTRFLLSCSYGKKMQVDQMDPNIQSLSNHLKFVCSWRISCFGSCNFIFLILFVVSKCSNKSVKGTQLVPDFLSSQFWLLQFRFLCR